MSSESDSVAEDALEDERAWRRHEMRMYIIMALVIGLAVAVIGMVLGGKLNHAATETPPAVEPVGLDQR